MLASINDIDLLVIVAVVTILLFVSFFSVLVVSLKRKMKYQQGMQQLKEEQQNQLIESAVKSEESERHRIAEQLHDEVGAILSSARLHLANIKAAGLSGTDASLHSTAKELLDAGIQKVRSISHNLHSSILKEFGLNEAVRHFIKHTAGQLAAVQVQLDEAYVAKNADDDISTYRMIQELVQNILKHAHASELTISSHFTGHNLQFVVMHNGDGLSQQQFEQLRFQTGGLGLRTILNRLVLLKGSIAFAKMPGRCTITLNIPKN
jgi:two-component system, NarL family, sensor kinase